MVIHRRPAHGTRGRQNGLRVGTFITSEDIELRGPTRISQMLDKAAGVSVYQGIPFASANNCPDDDLS